MYGIYKTGRGVICVGKQSADSTGVPVGNDIPVVNVTPWGNSVPQNESAVLVYYQSANLFNNNDDISLSVSDAYNRYKDEMIVYPVPAGNTIYVTPPSKLSGTSFYSITDVFNRTIAAGNFLSSSVDITALSNGVYLLSLTSSAGTFVKKFIVSK